MIQQKIRLGDLLVKEGLITEEQLEQALKLQKEYGYTKKLGQILLEEGYVTQKDLLKALSKQLHLEFVDLYGEKIDFEKLSRYPLNTLKAAKAIPFKEDDDYLYVATSDPLNYEALELLERTIAMKPIKLYLAFEDDIEAIFHRLEILEKTKEIVEEVKKELKSEGVKKAGEESAVERLIYLIIEDSIHRRASDIHIEPDEKRSSVRVRVDGVLYETFVFDLEIYNALDTRIKLLGGMDISERRKPQDGRFSLTVGGKPFDFRLSSTPTIYGESLVMRILDREKVLLKLEELGFSPKNLDKFLDVIHEPYGIVLITGPTGSGKTTTLYAALNEIKSIHNKIMTVEDPVEYRLPLVQQVQVNEKAGLTFAVAVKSFLRQDPDVMLIGEIRDFETLNASAQAALTGHLVFATLHTNDAPGAIPRLVQMGLKPYMIADALIGIVAQRLVRKICPYCKAEYKPPLSLLKKIEQYLPKDKEVHFYHGKGCAKCDFTGYFGRTMIAEILVVDDEIARLISEGATKFEILHYAMEQTDFEPMVQDGIKKALQGITTIEEVLRVAKENR
ncbi:GspE/PulE family protein [Nitratiruptor sp. SB155-2]|uniref:GspE/PulE family protein n=1 Tax=Nitratiruptor sp. (strain SB155-2) TaxID=387092 RepID=UPI000158723D|nr:GspE/PulE family protein [Nitratiruptor sp. SB155-2]BAF70670.1 general secretory pathway protein E [Nitratiruptor sp. SB155-2]